MLKLDENLKDLSNEMLGYRLFQANSALKHAIKIQDFAVRIDKIRDHLDAILIEIDCRNWNK
jgi:hypothetical protein